MSREGREKCYELQAVARRAYTEAVEEAGKVKRAAIDAAYAVRDRVFDEARQANVIARQRSPRDEAEIAATEKAIADAKSQPAPDLAEIHAEHQRATTAADQTLAAALADIRARFRAGDLDP